MTGQFPRHRARPQRRPPPQGAAQVDGVKTLDRLGASITGASTKKNAHLAMYPGMESIAFGNSFFSICGQEK